MIFTFLLGVSLKLCVYRKDPSKCPSNYTQLDIRDPDAKEMFSRPETVSIKCLFLTSMEDQKDRILSDFYFSVNLTQLIFIGYLKPRKIFFEPIFSSNPALAVSFENLTFETSKDLINCFHSVFINCEFISENPITIEATNIAIDPYTCRTITTLKANYIKFYGRFTGEMFEKTIYVEPQQQLFIMALYYSQKTIEISFQYHGILIEYYTHRIYFIPSTKSSESAIFNFNPTSHFKDGENNIILKSTITSKTINNIRVYIQPMSPTQLILPECLWPRTEENFLYVYHSVPLKINCSTEFIPFELRGLESVTLYTDRSIDLTRFFNLFGYNLTIIDTNTTNRNKEIIFFNSAFTNANIISDSSEIEIYLNGVQGDNFSTYGKSWVSFFAIPWLKGNIFISNFKLQEFTNNIGVIGNLTLEIESLTYVDDNSITFRVPYMVKTYENLLIGPSEIEDFSFSFQTRDGENFYNFSPTFTRNGSKSYLSVTKSQIQLPNYYCISANESLCPEHYHMAKIEDINFSDSQIGMIYVAFPESIEEPIKIAENLANLHFIGGNESVTINLDVNAIDSLAIYNLNVNFVNDQASIDHFIVSGSNIFGLTSLKSSKLILTKNSTYTFDIQQVDYIVLFTERVKNIVATDYNITVDEKIFNMKSNIEIKISNVVYADFIIKGEYYSKLSMSNDNLDSVIYVQSLINKFDVTKEPTRMKWQGTIVFIHSNGIVPLSLELETSKVFVPDETELYLYELITKNDTEFLEEASFAVKKLSMGVSSSSKGKDVEIAAEEFTSDSTKKNIVSVNTSMIKFEPESITSFTLLENDHPTNISIKFVYNYLPFIIAYMSEDSAGIIALVDSTESADFIKIEEQFQIDIFCSPNLTCANWATSLNSKNPNVTKLFEVKCSKGIADPDMFCISLYNVNAKSKLKTWMIVLISISAVIFVVLLAFSTYKIIFYAKRSYERRKLLSTHRLFNQSLDVTDDV
ncbi:hypothetical protein TVAG_457570 [Trichomonas vaginalis G3]|uniref:Uncharacterized protein n=1 Tax=Trichomonas vaginalis (strain ATCC PRA-98 / G3) TaxID=412133 RepID=A2DC80_TRIV3|nr:hypothetical protein TVAGG3_0262400 [Trichomonas vaginalis G3]EAY22121.1 hypothetical protein TVAG_457570 [Trichomonas vaginalis G3]KAI5525212.1 hypothetical protein TVAGG3_0262400 [Trichomonas vaginalis G3]|eukprot:XP_001583107.1 hypothetical protein [Trichomonas vaginalis G3]